MKKLALLFLAVSGLCCHAALTLISQETFIGPGALNSTSPGSNFSSVTGTLTLVRVGPRISSVAAPGWSADLRNTAGSIAYQGQFNLPIATQTCGMLGVWVRIKSYDSNGNYCYAIVLNNSNGALFDVGVDPNGYVTYGINGLGDTSSTTKIPLNTWTFLALAWQETGAQTWSQKIAVQPLGGTWTSVVSQTGLSLYAPNLASVSVGLKTGGYGPMLRIGCPSLYSMAGFSDMAYPGALIAPVEQPNTWYVNTVTGNDNNDGSTASTAWKSADKVTTESQYCGMLDSNAPGPGGGDVLTIDTSQAPLVIDTNTLTFATQGLKVQPVSSQNYIKCQAEEFLTNSAFTLAPGLAQTYQTSDTQANIVAWENDEWMWHVKSASYGASAAVTNPKTGVTTNYASTGAALDAIPGSFYTDGVHLYLHPFGNTNPTTDGNVYTRSIMRGSALAAVAFTAGNYLAIGFYVRKTSLVDSGDNDFGAYCFQDGVLSGNGMSSEEEGGYFAYGDKHCFGSTTGVTDSNLLILNTECEQGQPYCGYGGQSPFVSYSGVTTADNINTYQGCTCLARSGLIGSTAGDPVGTGGDIILSHNNGTGYSYSAINLNNCNFASGSATIGGATNLLLTNQTQIAQVNTYSPTTTVQETTFPAQLVTMETGATNLTVQNCLIKPVIALGPTTPVYYGFLVSGSVTIEGCTFDLSGLTGNSTSYFQQGLIQRQGLLNLTFRNNAYIVPSGENFPLLYQATSSDTLTFDHNAYNLGAGTILARAYSVSSSSSNLTFGQWQALGEDCSNSSLNSNLQLQNDIPQSGSPLINEGADLGSMVDVTGATYAHRNTIGAYQGSSTYLAPQSITGFPPLETATTGGGATILPATTTSGQTLTYTVVSGPATVSGNSLTLAGTGTITLTATQAGNGTYAPLFDTETITVSAPVLAATDTPTMPPWALAALAALLALAASPKARSSWLTP